MVRAAAAEDRQLENPLREWLMDCCVLEPEAWTATKLLRENFEAWAKANGEWVNVSAREFAEALASFGLQPERTKLLRGWTGIRLIPCTR